MVFSAIIPSQSTNFSPIFYTWLQLGEGAGHVGKEGKRADVAEVRIVAADEPAPRFSPFRLAIFAPDGDRLVVWNRNGELSVEDLPHDAVFLSSSSWRASAVLPWREERYHAWRASGASVCPYLADQLMLPIALAGGAATCGTPSLHAWTNLEVIAAFTGVRLTVRRDDDGRHRIANEVAAVLG